MTTTTQIASLDLPGIASARMTSLIANIEHLGIELPSIHKYRTLSKLPTMEPKKPERLLDLTPDQLETYIREKAIYDTISGAPYHTLNIIQKNLSDALLYELKQALHQEGPILIDALRPRFTQAANSIRKAAAAGLQPHHQPDNLLEESDSLRAAYRAAVSAGNELDTILRLRQTFSLVTGYAPAKKTLDDEYFRLQLSRGEISTQINWSTTVTSPESNAKLGPLDPSNSWARWLKIAEHLELTTPKGE